MGQGNEASDVRGYSRLRQLSLWLTEPQTLCQPGDLGKLPTPFMPRFLRCKLGTAVCLPHCVVAKDEMSYVNTAWNSTRNRTYRTSNSYR